MTATERSSPPSRDHVIRADEDDPELCAKIDSCFEGADSDIDRTKQYRNQKEREKEKLRCKSVEEYNNSLESRVETSLCSEEDAPRVAELSQRTNQFNLSGARYTEDDVRRFIASDEYRVLSLRASDKYGDMGIVGAAVVCLGDYPVIEGFFISCAAFSGADLKSASRRGCASTERGRTPPHRQELQSKISTRKTG
ncbi:MAG: hypothetical protein ACLUFM_01545 [Lachnospiraceae bacterium]